MTVGQAAARYLGSLEAGDRELAASEINRFVRTIGADRDLGKLTKLDIERYQQQLADRQGESALRVEALKAFLTDLKTKRLTETNLGAGLRIRRRAGGSARGKKQVRSHDAEPALQLTREGYDQLQAELDRLENEEAPAVREELAEAYQDKDFRENAPYDAAKRRMGEIQGRINTLRAQLGKAEIVQRQGHTERAGLGSRVVLRDLAYDEEIVYTLVGPGEVDTRNGCISIQSPVGSAIKDHGVGDVVEVDIPSGTARYRVEKIQRA